MAKTIQAGANSGSHTPSELLPERITTPQECNACSKSTDFLDILLTQVVGSHPLQMFPEESRDKVVNAAARAFLGIQPNGELEGMIAAQLVAAHNVAMECYRRANVPNMPFKVRDGHLNQANKLSRTFVILLEALNKHRGKGHQRVTVEHVHVHQGGQAIVGHVEPGGGIEAKTNGLSPCS
jgi:hypothetical protein